MKNQLIKTILFLFAINFMSAQWTHKLIDNKFDAPFKKAYTNTNNYGFLTMEPALEGYDKRNPFMALKGSYFCDENTTIDFVLIVNGKSKLYTVDVLKSEDSTLYYFYATIWTEEFIQDFKKATKCLLRVNQSHCKDEYYEFVFGGSTAAYDFVTK